MSMSSDNQTPTHIHGNTLRQTHADTHTDTNINIYIYIYIYIYINIYTPTHMGVFFLKNNEKIIYIFFLIYAYIIICKSYNMQYILFSNMSCLYILLTNHEKKQS
eukprot:GHVR01092496.1.p3 GENE.GHVR01092496.1~~GHVR01092496.1.p3  ORF type:complete len:105 (-),score=27.36 GHVR01092496.1:652-966(-)